MVSMRSLVTNTTQPGWSTALTPSQTASGTRRTGTGTFPVVSGGTWAAPVLTRASIPNGIATEWRIIVGSGYRLPGSRPEQAAVPDHIEGTTNLDPLRVGMRRIDDEIT